MLSHWACPLVTTWCVTWPVGLGMLRAVFNTWRFFFLYNFFALNVTLQTSSMCCRWMFIYCVRICNPRLCEKLLWPQVLFLMVRKLKKSSGDVTESLSGLSLEESSSQMQTEILTSLESVYSFTCTQPTHFPQTHCREFTQQLQRLPTGKTPNLVKHVGVTE